MTDTTDNRRPNRAIAVGRSHGSFRVGHYSLAPDYGQIAFATAIAAWVVWYYFDALAASPNVQNMLLIRPATVVALILWALIVGEALKIRRVDAAADDEPVEPGSAPAPVGLRGPAVAVLLCAYVALIPNLGFDIASFLFVASSMAAAGERRIWVLILYPTLFAAGMALAFRFALSTPVPTMLFGE